MTPGERRRAVRAAGPVLALAAVTAAVVGARAALHDDPQRGVPPPAPSREAAVSRPPAQQPPTAPPAPPAVPRREYTIRSGDTLDAVAAAHDTTVDELLVLNPGVDPTALRVGQRIRLP